MITTPTNGNSIYPPTTNHRLQLRCWELGTYYPDYQGKWTKRLRQEIYKWQDFTQVPPTSQSLPSIWNSSVDLSTLELQ